MGVYLWSVPWTRVTRGSVFLWSVPWTQTVGGSVCGLLLGTRQVALSGPQGPSQRLSANWKALSLNGPGGTVVSGLQRGTHLQYVRSSREGSVPQQDRAGVLVTTAWPVLVPVKHCWESAHPEGAQGVLGVFLSFASIFRVHFPLSHLLVHQQRDHP